VSLEGSAWLAGKQQKKIKYMCFERVGGSSATRNTSRETRYEQTEDLVAQRGKFGSAGDLN